MPEPQTKVSVYLHGKLIREDLLPPGEYMVGQDEGGQISVAQEAFGGAQARLRLANGQGLIEDLGSLDGTLVDGETIMVPTIVLPGQKIRLGAVEIALGPSREGDLSSTEATPAVLIRRPLTAEIRNPNKYEMGRTVARGGMGVILSARDVIVQREVAMKLMLDATKPESVARFFQEAQITAQLEHPNIVPVHELSLNAEGLPFYTMKLVRGISLKKVLEGVANQDPAIAPKWPLSALLTVFQKVCDAIAFAHARGVIHRDLKPDNIMLGEYGEAQVMDWGLAKVHGQDAITRAAAPVGLVESEPAPDAEETTVGPTISGTILGTPQYMSPEQADGAIELLDERTDIYSLGAILYHILVLRPPFLGRTNREVLDGVRAGNIVPLSAAAGQKRLSHLPGGRLPESLAAVALKAMSREKARRYPTVETLQGEIASYQNGFATSAEQAGWWKLAGLFLRRHRTVSLAAGLLLLSGIVFSFNLARERDRARRASVEAQEARGIADEQRDAAENQLYLADMLQAGRHLADGRPESARELLQRHRVEPSGRDLRGWEWFYLAGEANQDRLRVDAHRGGVFAVAASADGARLATGGGDGQVAVWQARGLVPEFRFPALGDTVLAVGWHPDGNLLAAGSADGVVRIWDVATRKTVAEFRLPSDAPVRSLGWRPGDGGTPTLAIGSTERGILLWHPLAPGAAGGPETFASTGGGVAALHWAADGQRLAAGELGSRAAIEVFDFARRTQVLSSNVVSGNDAFCIAMDPSGKRVAAGSKHRVVAVYEVSPKKLVFEEAAHRGFVSALAWSPDGQQLASAGHDGTLRVSSPLKSKGAGQILSGHVGAVNALIWARLPARPAPARPSTALFSGGADGTLRAWLPSTGSALAERDENWIAAARWSPDGTRLAIANFRDLIHLFDPASGLGLPICSTHGNIFDVVWSPGGDRLATTSRDGQRVEVLAAATGRSLGIFALPGAYRAAWSPSGRYLAACGSQGARVWDTTTGALVVVISRPASCLLWHPDERRIVLGGDDGAIELRDAFTGNITATWRPASPAITGSMSSEKEPPRRVCDLRWSAGARLLAFGTQDSLAGVLDGQDGHLVRTFTGHTSGVWRVAWNADGRRLATAGQDGMLRVYEPAVGGQVAHINHGLGQNELHSLDWSPDGRRLVSGGFDRFVRVWDAARGHALDAVESAVQEERATPGDPAKVRRLASIYAQLGWAGDARRAFAAARAVAPDDTGLQAAAVQAENSFSRALDFPPSGDDLAPAQNPRAIELVAAIYTRWEAGKSDAALAAWRELIQTPGSDELLPLARTYFSRARWSATWFASRVDPLGDPDGWRAQADSPAAVTAAVRLLCFPYLQRGPKDLLLTPELIERGPGDGAFGMVARARFQLPAGKWRFRTVGGDGARVLLNEQAIIENWMAGAPPEKTADYEQTAAGAVDITVEHFVSDGTDDFQFLIEPVAE